MVLVVSPDKLPRVRQLLEETAASGDASGDSSSSSSSSSVMVLGRVQQRPSSFCPQVMVYGGLDSPKAAAAAAAGEQTGAPHAADACVCPACCICSMRSKVRSGCRTGSNTHGCGTR